MALSRQTRYRLLEIFLLFAAAIAAAFLLVNLLNPSRSTLYLYLSGLSFTASLLLFLRVLLDPDRVRASQSDAMLRLASDTLKSLSTEGLTLGGAQEVCERMLPATSAIAVAITDKEKIIGYAGRDKKYNEIGAPIRTAATLATIKEGRTQVLRTQEEVGMPEGSSIRSAIIAPLRMSNETIGALKFYYPSARSLNETEESIAQGYADLLSTQVSAHALKEQRELATSMELKLLQSQINPHFLFNTINTITSLIRTDPEHARELLRDFASFYRSVLENSSDLITLEREIEQTKRYMGFEIARFGEERLQFDVSMKDGTELSLVPAFMVQPLVENAVRHAMPAEGTLHISCTAMRSGADLTVIVEDDGLGMSNDAEARLANGKTTDGLGIAMRNIQERIRGYYGDDSSMEIESEEGRGTRVKLLLKGSCAW
ncbi:MAG: histidine kinase [Eggerthellaceae bacterium]|nr:histidine kinase [Eggerthellaceae bacterium]